MTKRYNVVPPSDVCCFRFAPVTIVRYVRTINHSELLELCEPQLSVANELGHHLVAFAPNKTHVMSSLLLPERQGQWTVDHFLGPW